MSRATFSKDRFGSIFTRRHLLAAAHEVKRPFQNSTADVGSAAFTSKRAAFAAALDTSFRDRHQNATLKPAVRDARTAKMTPAQLDGAWLYSHPRSPKAARSTPAGAYHPLAR